MLVLTQRGYKKRRMIPAYQAGITNRVLFIESLYRMGKVLRGVIYK